MKNKNTLSFIYTIFFLIPLQIHSEEFHTTSSNIENIGISKQIEIVLTSDKIQYTPCEPIILSITATNVSSSTLSIFLPLSLSKKNFSFSVTHPPENQMVSLTSYGNNLYQETNPKSGSGYITTFKPTNSFIKKFQINRIHDMSQSGEYIISASFDFTDFASRQRLFAKSNPIHLTITDDNPCIKDVPPFIKPFKIESPRKSIPSEQNK